MLCNREMIKEHCFNSFLQNKTETNVLMLIAIYSINTSVSLGIKNYQVKADIYLWIYIIEFQMLYCLSRK